VVVDAGAGYSSYLWDDGDTTQSNTFYNFGSYTVVVTDTNNCIDSDSVTISPTYFYYTISADTTISLGAAIDLTANAGSGYLWNTGDTTQTISVSPIVDETFTATTLLANGCYEVGTINVLVNEELNIFIPNMFSPNGDGSNDVFLLYGFGLQEINFRIFNRWGKEIWSTTDPIELVTTGWNGTSNGEDQPTGTYVWTMTGTTITGTPVTFNDQNKGTLLLRR
jgi:gliding motility-associated-like protein